MSLFYRKCAHLSSIERRRVVRVHEENIFRLKVSVGEFVVVQKFDGVAELVSDMAHLFHWVGLVVVFSLKISF